MNYTDPGGVVARVFALGPGGHGFNPCHILHSALKNNTVILLARGRTSIVHFSIKLQGSPN